MVAFVGWALFFVADGDTKAIMKVGVPIIVGVVLGYQSLYGLELGGELGVIGAAIAVGAAALIIILLMTWAPTALAPAAVASFATFFGVMLVKRRTSLTSTMSFSTCWQC